MKIKHQYSGKSLLELKKDFGIGSSGFWNNSWWLNETFANDRADAGEYEIILDKELVDMTYDEQVKKLKKGFEVAHPAVIVEAVLEYYKKTGKRLLDNWYVRTNCFTPYGDRVCLGSFDACGLDVSHDWDDYRYSNVGLSAMKLGNLKPCKIDTSLNSRLDKIETFLSNNFRNYEKTNLLTLRQ